MSGNAPKTITIYEDENGKPRPSSDSFFLKQGEKLRWETATDKDYRITFEDEEALGFKKDTTKLKENHPFTKEWKAKKIGSGHKYSIQELPDGPILDPTIDIGKP